MKYNRFVIINKSNLFVKITRTIIVFSKLTAHVWANLHFEITANDVPY